MQKDPREKLENFPKLGYYFISFRAIESQAERAKILREAQNNAEGDAEPDEVPVGEANVYLAVFNSGVCCVCAVHLFDAFYSDIPISFTTVMYLVRCSPPS